MSAPSIISVRTPIDVAAHRPKLGAELPVRCLRPETRLIGRSEVRGRGPAPKGNAEPARRTARREYDCSSVSLSLEAESTDPKLGLPFASRK